MTVHSKTGDMAIFGLGYLRSSARQQPQQQPTPPSGKPPAYDGDSDLEAQFILSTPSPAYLAPSSPQPPQADTALRRPRVLIYQDSATATTAPPSYAAVEAHRERRMNASRKRTHRRGAMFVGILTLIIVAAVLGFM